MRTQAQIAIDSADCIIFVTDVRTGMVATDLNIAQMLQRSNVRSSCASIRMRYAGRPAGGFFMRFYNLGLGDPFRCLPCTDTARATLLDAVLEHLRRKKRRSGAKESSPSSKPNVGKSSLVNRVSGENRCIVSTLRILTRDAVDHRKQSTAYLRSSILPALRRKRARWRIPLSITATCAPKWRWTGQSNVCVILIDATVGFLRRQDSRLPDIAHESGQGCIIAVNKWDAVEKDKTMQEDTRRSLKGLFTLCLTRRSSSSPRRPASDLTACLNSSTKVASSNAMRIRPAP